MTDSATCTLAWLQAMSGAALIFASAHAALRWVREPVDRVRWIQFALAAATAVPFALACPLLSLWRWEVPAIAADEAARRDAARTTVVAPPGRSNVANQPRPPAVSSSSSEHGGEIDRDAADASSPPPTIKTPVASEPLAKKHAFDVWSWSAATIVAAHLGAAAYFALEWFVGAWRLRALRRDATPASSEVLEEWRRVTSGRGERVAILVSGEVDSPCVFGWLRPTVVVPANVAATGGAALRYCLAHEWAHLERGDLWRLAAVRVLRLAFWPLPHFWRLRRELLGALDLLADDAAAEGGREAIPYAELLLSLARARLTRVPAHALSLTDRRHPLTRRVEMLLEKSEPWRRRCSSRFTLSAAGAMAIGLVLVSSIRVSAVRAEPPAAATVVNQNSSRADSTNSTNDAEGPFRLSGYVVDGETGQGVADALVIVIRSLRSSEGLQVSREETYHGSDGDGRYEFEITAEQAAVPGYKLAVAVEHPDYARLGVDESPTLPQLLRPERAGERRSARIKVWRAAEITGRVVDPNGSPCVAAQVGAVSLLRPYEEGDPIAAERTSAHATTDGDGRFRLRVYEPGSVALAIEAHGFVAFREDLGTRRGKLGEFRLRAGVSVRGRVFDAAGRGVPNAAVNFHRARSDAEAADYLRRFGPDSLVLPSHAYTDGDGIFSSVPLEPGEYFCDVYATGSTEARLPGLYPSRRVTVLERDTPLVELRPAAEVELRVRLVDSHGGPQTAPSVHVNGESPDGGYWNGRAPFDAAGRATLRVPRGLNARVTVADDVEYAFRHRRGADGALENHADDLPVAALDEEVNAIELVRYRAPTALLRVLDEDGRPIADSRTIARYRWRAETNRLPANGQPEVYLFPRNDGVVRSYRLLPDEETTFTVEAAGYATQSRNASLAEGEERTLTFRLKKSPTAGEASDAR